MSYNSDMAYHYLNKCKFSFAPQTDNSLSSCLLALRKSFAFTLAEVLITLGIIGIVAAMTIPTLISKHQEKVAVVQLKKNFSVINQAVMMTYSQEGDPSTWNVGQTLNLELQRIAKNLKPLEVCVNGSDCKSHVDFKYVDGNSLNRDGYLKIVMPDGINFYLSLSNTACNSTKTWLPNENLKNICGDVYIDINGDKGPNELAVDLFNFYLTKYGVYPSGTSDNFVRFDTYCTPSNITWGCTAWVLTYENRDYLRCPEKLSWDGKHTCKE